LLSDTIEDDPPLEMHRPEPRPNIVARPPEVRIAADNERDVVRRSYHPGGRHNNKLRHETLQKFMLINDSVTVAIEVPIWLTETDIAALEKQHGIELAPRVGAAERSITGHIDFLQVRNGAVRILDYKPDARTNRPIAQLAIYALALTRLRLFDIKCAWFNEEEYLEFFPRTLFVMPATPSSAVRAQARK
jgi:hypothetical protein